MSAETVIVLYIKTKNERTHLSLHMDYPFSITTGDVMTFRNANGAGRYFRRNARFTVEGVEHDLFTGKRAIHLSTADLTIPFGGSFDYNEVLNEALAIGFSIKETRAIAKK